MTSRRKKLSAVVPLLLAGIVLSPGNAQEAAAPVKGVQLTGLTGVKENTKGTLQVGNGKLQFVYGKGNSDLSTASIENVVTGADSQAAVGKTVGMMSMAAPYGSGRFLALFRTKIDTLTIQYRDADGGVHGAIFTMPAGTADLIKKELVAQGAHTTAAQAPDAPSDPSSAPTNKEQNR
jgi:hypothetical protein